MEPNALEDNNSDTVQSNQGQMEVFFGRPMSLIHSACDEEQPGTSKKELVIRWIVHRSVGIFRTKYLSKKILAQYNSC